MVFDAALSRAIFPTPVDSCMHLVTDLLTKGAHLDDVGQESEICRDFVRKGRYQDAAEAIISQQQFIRNLRGADCGFFHFQRRQLRRTEG